METKLKLENALQKLIGLTCNEFRFGVGTGSIIKLSFDSSAVLLSGHDDSKSYLNRKQGLLVNCAWRLLNQTKKSFTWRDIGIRDNALDNALNLLINNKISSTLYDEKTNDLSLQFEDGTEFHIMCDIANDDEAEENYIFFSDLEVIFVDYEGRVQTEQYENH